MPLIFSPPLKDRRPFEHVIIAALFAECHLQGDLKKLEKVTMIIPVDCDWHMIAREDPWRYYRFTPLDVDDSTATILGTPYPIPANALPEHRLPASEPASFDAGCFTSAMFASFMTIIMASRHDLLLRVTDSVSEITAHYKRRIGLSSWFFDIIELLRLHQAARAEATLIFHTTGRAILQVQQDQIRIEVRPIALNLPVFIMTPSRFGNWDVNKDEASSTFSIACCNIEKAFETILILYNAASD